MHLHRGIGLGNQLMWSLWKWRGSAYFLEGFDMFSSFIDVKVYSAEGESDFLHQARDYA